MSSSSRSTTAVAANFVNILTDMEKQGDLAYAMKSKKFPVYKYAKWHTSKDIRRETLASERVQRAIDVTASERNLSRKNVESEASKIADEMFQNFDMKYPRMLVVLAKKCLPRIFSAIYVDSLEKVQKIRQMAVEDPILFVPSHRTYMDFILLQFVCFHFEIPLPAIASAIDFMRMKIMGEMLRRSGAYFIRRSFKDDFLYRTIFTEYVQTQIIDGDRPLEVFVEGTRSRTGKSLRPKHGFLSTVLEPYLTSRVFDIKIVPVNLSFCKILEESLYAYEVLGFSKPPETTSGLLKARRVLDTCYGDAFITFGDPISVRDYFAATPTIDRRLHNLHSSFEFTDDEKRAVNCLSSKIVKLQESKAVLNLWSLAALQMNVTIAYGDNNVDESPIVDYEKLRADVDKLYDLFSRLGIRIPLRTGSLIDELNYRVNLHKNIVQLSPDGRFLKLLAAETPTFSSPYLESFTAVRSLVGSAVSRLILANFANNSMHMLAEICFLTINFDSGNFYEYPTQRLYEEFSFLQTLYGREFIYEPSKTKENFNLTLNRCVNANILEITRDNIVRTCNGSTDVEVLKSFFEPWLISYAICADFLHACFGDVAEKQYCRLVQDGIAKKLKDTSLSEPRWYQILSFDTIKNALHSFEDVGAVIKVKSVGGDHLAHFHGDSERLDEIKMRLEKYLDNCYKSSADAKIKAKL